MRRIPIKKNLHETHVPHMSTNFFNDFNVSSLPSKMLLEKLKNLGNSISMDQTTAVGEFYPNEKPMEENAHSSSILHVNWLTSIN